MLRKSAIFFSFMLIISLIFPITTRAVESSSKSAILMEENSERILYNKNSDEPLPMASTTKIMTAIVAIEYGNLDDIVVIDDETPYIEGSSIYLKTNDKISLEDLVYALVLRSGNDAADSIAKHIGGTMDNFITLMNEKAKVIGASNTNFVNPHGLHDANHYTTAEDLLLITKYAFGNDIFKRIVGTTNRDIKINNEKRTIFNKNKMVTQYEGGNGVKTGYTTDAGKCLVFSAERNGMQLIGVLIDSYNIWTDSEILLDYGFEKYKLENVVTKSEYLGSIYIDKGIKDTVKIYATSDINIPVTGDETLSTELTLNKNLTAPIYSKQKIGTLDIKIEDNIIYTEDLYCPEKIYVKDFFKFFKESITNFFKIHD